MLIFVNELADRLDRSQSNVTSHRNPSDSGRVATADDTVEALLRFGVAMLRAGGTAARTHELMDGIARKLGLQSLSLSQSLDSLTVTVRQPRKWLTAMREIGPPAVNVSRIAHLEQLARSIRPNAAPRDIAKMLTKIESELPLYSAGLIAAAVGAASAGFAFINGAAGPELTAAAAAGTAGQWFRARLSRNKYSQYATAALAALIASGAYVLLAASARKAGVEFTNFPAGFMASVLFLVPGFPLVGGLFDLLQHQTVAAVSRLACGTMILLSVGLGLSIVVAVAGVDVSRQPPAELVYLLILLLRALASVVAGCAFAMLFNSSFRTALAAGLVALCANSLRLALTDIGVMLAPAAFFSSLVIGVVAILADRRYHLPRIAMTVAPVVIMMPGVTAFEMIVLFNRGQMVEALQASASCGFVIGALAMGLATARIFSPK